MNKNSQTEMKVISGFFLALKKQLDFQENIHEEEIHKRG